MVEAIIVASLDTRTGDTLLVSVPRALGAAQFPEGSDLRLAFPKGWYDGSNPGTTEFQLGAMYSSLPKYIDLAVHVSANPGADAMKLSVGYMLGLSIDYYIALDVDALADLVDGLGGVTVNVNKDIPTASGVIPAGADTRFPDGDQLVAYVSSLEADDDAHRMARTRCLVYDLLQQTSGSQAASQFADLESLRPDSFRSDIPASTVGDLAALAVKAQDAQIIGMQFVSGQQGYSNARPNFELMGQLVEQGLASFDQPTTASPQEFWQPQALDQFCAFDAAAGW
ncbi:MAG: LCP family protein [Propionibacteriaceae bacterium]|nr:LCP family protein [Propionibacteriaceae bacterium]